LFPVVAKKKKEIEGKNKRKKETYSSTDDVLQSFLFLFPP
jgi:hypothetical protein